MSDTLEKKIDALLEATSHLTDVTSQLTDAVENLEIEIQIMRGTHALPIVADLGGRTEYLPPDHPSRPKRREPSQS